MPGTFWIWEGKMLSLITWTQVHSWHRLAEYVLVGESKKLQPTELNTEPMLAGSKAREGMNEEERRN